MTTALLTCVSSLVLAFEGFLSQRGGKQLVRKELLAECLKGTPQNRRRGGACAAAAGAGPPGTHRAVPEAGRVAGAGAILPGAQSGLDPPRSVAGGELCRTDRALSAHPVHIG